MKPLKIAFIVDRFGNRFGGAESYGVELMRELSKKHDITVFARDYDYSCGLELKYIPLKYKSYWPSWYRVLRHAIKVVELTRTGFDIVHSHSNGWAGNIEVMHVVPVRYNWRVRTLPFLKLLGSYISPRVQTYLRLEAMRVAQRSGKRVVAVSSLIKSQLQQAYGSSLKVSVIPPGVHLPDISSLSNHNEQRAEVRLKLNYTDTDIVGIMVARNPLRKGLAVAMQAYAQLPDQHKLLVVGSSPETDNALHSMPEYQKLNSRLTLIPATSDVSTYYRAANLCVHPTLNDSFGMAPLEAMSFGLPIILSPSPWCGFASYLEHGKNALILQNPHDIAGLVQEIEKLSANKELYKRLQTAGLEVAEQHEWEVVANKYMDLYYAL